MTGSLCTVTARGFGIVALGEPGDKLTKLAKPLWLCLICTAATTGRSTDADRSRQHQNAMRAAPLKPPTARSTYNRLENSPNLNAPRGHAAVN